MIDPWMGAAIGLAAGCLLGGVIVYLTQKTRGGGKTARQVQSEFADYREQVQTHFDKTSDLFRGMTQQYRDLYTHLSSGAQTLCETTPTGGALGMEEPEMLPHRDSGGNGAVPAETTFADSSNHDKVDGNVKTGEDQEASGPADKASKPDARSGQTAADSRSSANDDNGANTGAVSTPTPSQHNAPRVPDDSEGIKR